MRNLIKKLLKEYFNPEIKIEVVGWCSDELLEQLMKNNRIISEQLRLVYIPVRPWKTAITQIENYIESNFPIVTSFIDTKNEDRPYERFGGIANISVSDHYYQRLFRSFDPNYRPGGRYYNARLVDPDPLEGVRLIHDNASEILRAIMTQDPKKRANLRLIIYKNNRPIYTVVAAPKYPGDKIEGIPYFNLSLITQIKGDSLRDDEIGSNNKKRVNLDRKIK
jgi:hypothetical protein